MSFKINAMIVGVHVNVWLMMKDCLVEMSHTHLCFGLTFSVKFKNDSGLSGWLSKLHVGATFHIMFGFRVQFNFLDDRWRQHIVDTWRSSLAIDTLHF